MPDALERELVNVRPRRERDFFLDLDIGQDQFVAVVNVSRQQTTVRRGSLIKILNPGEVTNRKRYCIVAVPKKHAEAMRSRRRAFLVTMPVPVALRLLRASQEAVAAGTGDFWTTLARLHPEIEQERPAELVRRARKLSDLRRQAAEVLGVSLTSIDQRWNAERLEELIRDPMSLTREPERLRASEVEDLIPAGSVTEPDDVNIDDFTEVASGPARVAEVKPIADVGPGSDESELATINAQLAALGVKRKGNFSLEGKKKLLAEAMAKKALKDNSPTAQSA
jgi:hypothetical protein